MYQLNCAGAVAVAYVSGAETVGAETAGAEMSQRRNGERRNGGAEMAAPKCPAPRTVYRYSLFHSRSGGMGHHLDLLQDAPQMSLVALVLEMNMIALVVEISLLQCPGRLVLLWYAIRFWVM